MKTQPNVVLKVAVVLYTMGEHYLFSKAFYLLLNKNSKLTYRNLGIFKEPHFLSEFS
jgi:hypothetical protein